MKKPRTKARKTGAAASSSKTQRRLWLMYPPKLIQQPLIWQLSDKFHIITNIRQASVTDEIGIVCLEVDGKQSEIERAIDWMEKQGVKVEPVEINVIES